MDDPNQVAELQTRGLAPQSSSESALVTSLPPGQYTAVVAGQGGGIGVGLIEVYAVQ